MSYIIGNLWRSYNVALVERPLATKSITSFFGYVIGDIIAQKLTIDQTKQKSKFSIERNLKFASYGALITGPVCHYFYKFLDHRIKGTSLRSTLYKVCIDQFLVNPILNTVFISYFGLVDCKPINEIVGKLQTDLKTMIIASWVVWIPANFINFRYIPLSQRVLYVNIILVGYNIFLSTMSVYSDNDMPK